MPPEGERTGQLEIPSNLTLLETFPALRTRKKTNRMDPTRGTIHDDPETELNNTSTIGTKKPVTSVASKTKAKPKKKPPTVAPINKMVNPYTPQQFFDQPANITNGQLLAMNPKFGLMVARQLRKPVIKKNKDGEIQTENKQETTTNETNEEEPLMQMHSGVEINRDKSTALYCDASIKNIQFPLIVDSGSAGSIMSLSLLKDLDMEITSASKTVMINVNGERRRPLGAVSDVPLKVGGCIIPLDVIVTQADSYAAIVGNDWLRKTKANINYDKNMMTIT